MQIPVIPNFKPFDDKSAAEKVRLLRQMLIIRIAEDAIADLVLDGRIKTPCHLYAGQEAVAVGVCDNLTTNDYVFSNHRAHGHYLAKGGDLNAMMAEIFCKATGCSGGRGGSMHLCAPEVGILGTSSIVAGTLGLCLGAALASKMRNEGDISVVFHGDTVLEEGIWNESANFAALNKLPLVYICENNLYSAHMPLLSRRLTDNLSEVAAAHGLQCSSCDGNNVLEVAATARAAIDKARNGAGAQFIECRTYRFRGHVGPHDDIDKGIRDADELAFWKNRCPIKTLSAYLIDTGEVTAKDLEALTAECRQTVNTALAFAENSRYPSTDTLLNNLYAV